MLGIFRRHTHNSASKTPLRAHFNRSDFGHALGGGGAVNWSASLQTQAFVRKGEPAKLVETLATLTAGTGSVRPNNVA